jgi:uncharacterized protein involved in exopolysaccharide biosynthesis
MPVRPDPIDQPPAFPATDQTVNPDASIQFIDLVAAARSRARLLTVLLVLAWAGAVAFALIPARRYPAAVTVAAVPNPRLSLSGGGLSAILAGAQMGGVQSTPYLVAQLFQLRSVLLAVAGAKPPGPGLPTVVERLRDEPLSEIPIERVEAEMRDVVEASVDRQTGLVTVSVVHTDSALTRFVATRLLAEASALYGRVLHAQADDQRAALRARVDSATRALRRSEERLHAFVDANRGFLAYAPASVAQQRAAREVQNAQAAYAQTVSDLQQAEARALEEPPAMVVVDPLPSELAPAPRRAALLALLATMIALAIGCALIVASLPRSANTAMGAGAVATRRAA